MDSRSQRSNFAQPALQCSRTIRRSIRRSSIISVASDSILNPLSEVGPLVDADPDDLESVVALAMLKSLRNEPVGATAEP